MATIKSYTDLEQSKKLAEILPLESADMYWDYDIQRHEHYPMVMDDQFDDTCTRAWSLAALLSVLPSGYVIVKNYHSFYYVESRGHERSTNIFNNPIDACVAMIEKLHELNLL